MKKPVVVYSSWSNNVSNSILNQKEYAKVSNHLAQKAGYETVLYTDQKSKSILGDIPYNKIIDFDENILNQLPKTVWASAKILAFSLQKDPFMHIDFDFFIVKNTFYDKVKDKDFFIFHEEPWFLEFSSCLYNNGVEKILEVTNNDFNVKLTPKSMSLNFSIFGSCQEKVIPVIKKQSTSIINILIKYKQELENSELLDHFKNHFEHISIAVPSVIIEQIILPNLIMQELKTSYYPIMYINRPKLAYKKFKDIDLIHLWGLKNHKKIRSLIEKFFN